MKGKKWMSIAMAIAVVTGTGEIVRAHPGFTALCSEIRLTNETELSANCNSLNGPSRGRRTNTDLTTHIGCNVGGHLTWRPGGTYVGRCTGCTVNTHGINGNVLNMVTEMTCQCPQFVEGINRWFCLPTSIRLDEHITVTDTGQLEYNSTTWDLYVRHDELRK